MSNYDLIRSQRARLEQELRERFPTVSVVDLLSHADKTTIALFVEQRLAQVAAETAAAFPDHPDQTAAALGDVVERWGARMRGRAEFTQDLRTRETVQPPILPEGPVQPPPRSLGALDSYVEDAVPAGPVNETVHAWRTKRRQWVDTEAVWECSGPECDRINAASRETCWHCGRRRTDG